jgi:hypothetical protein
LRIVPSGNIGKLGEHKGIATLYDWKWYYNVSGNLLWLALLLAIAAPKSNRDLRILLILIPVLVANVLYVALKRVSGMPASAAARYDMILQSLVVGTAILWLLAPRFANVRGLGRFLLSLGVLVGVAYLGVLSIGMSSSTREVFMFGTCLQVVLLVGIVAAGHLCRWRYRPWRLLLWLGVCEMTMAVVGLFVFFLIAMAAIPLSASNMWDSAPRIIPMGLILGLGLYVLALPFMILGFTSPLFRDRLRACLSLRSPAEPAGPATDQSAGPPS